MRNVRCAGRRLAGNTLGVLLLTALAHAPAGLAAAGPSAHGAEVPRDARVHEAHVTDPTHIRGAHVADSAELRGTDAADSTRAREAAATPFFAGAFLGDARSTPERIAGAIEDFARLTGGRPTLVKTFLRLGDDFSSRGWPGRVVRQIEETGATNFIALDLGGLDHGSEGLLAALLAGAGDRALQDAARGLREVDGAVLLELAWEMNGDWGYAWQGAANGGDAAAPRRFVAAWRRIVEVFRAEGAHNVRFVFSPNTGNPIAGAGADESHWNWYGHYYPGDAYVDYVGAHGFNGPSVWGGPDRGFGRLFDGREMGGMLSDLERRFDKPIIIGEFATQETGGRAKAAWIDGAYRAMMENPAVVGAVWFHMDKEADWRVDSSPAALEAYRQAVSAPRVSGSYADVRGSQAGPVRLARR